MQQCGGGADSTGATGVARALAVKPRLCAEALGLDAGVVAGRERVQFGVKLGVLEYALQRGAHRKAGRTARGSHIADGSAALAPDERFGDTALLEREFGVEFGGLGVGERSATLGLALADLPVGRDAGAGDAGCERD